MGPDTHTFQISRLQAALAWADSQAPGFVSPRNLADRAGMSLAHFYRHFAVLAGMPAGTYLRRRALAQAAIEVMGTSRRILDIALDAGFSSHEGFTRAFEQEFSYTPLQARVQAPFLELLPPWDPGWNKDWSTPALLCCRSCTIRGRDISLPLHLELQEHRIARFWGEMIFPYMPAELRPEAFSLEQFAPYNTSWLRHRGGWPARAGHPCPPGFQDETLPGGLFMRCISRLPPGPKKSEHLIYHAFDTLLPRSRFQTASDRTREFHRPDGVMELYIPVAPRVTPA